MMRCVVMGVAGCGKSSVGQALADGLSASYLDGDDLHPVANIEKMARGSPLNDNDRWPWLDLIGRQLHDAEGPILLGCSALKKSYRDRIRTKAGTTVIFVHLAGSLDVITRRMSARKDHFMPLSLLNSQFETLEDLQNEEVGFSVDIDQPFEAVVDACRMRLEEVTRQLAKG